MKARAWQRQRGMAYFLVMISVAVALILGMSFLNAQATSTHVAQNVVNRASARGIAESGIEIAMQYIRSTSNWRTAQVSGVWLPVHAIGGGGFVLRFEDENDGDLADDPLEPVTLTCVGDFEGLSHKVRATINPTDPPDPFAGWELDETSGVIAVDVKGNYNGTYSNGVTLGQSGAVDPGTAVKFDGVDDRIESAGSPALRLDGDLTVAFWVKPAALPIGTSKHHIFVSRADADDEDYARMFSLSATSSGDLYYRHEYGEEGENNKAHTFSTADLTVATWYHVALTRDVASNELSLYVNGTLEETWNYTGSDPEGYNNGILFIGRYTSGGALDGALDGVMVYKRVLNAVEVVSHARRFRIDWLEEQP